MFHRMRTAIPSRLISLVALATSGMALAQSAPPATPQNPPAGISVLPATPPTTFVPPAPVPQAPAGPPQRRAEIRIDGQTVSVHANNSSLNQILRDLARSVNMKISGGVADDRVFGDYGPAPLGDVVVSLLNGIQSNMLFTAATATTPAELVLTPRAGGPTPPSVFAAGVADSDQAPVRGPMPTQFMMPDARNTPVPQETSTPAPQQAPTENTAPDASVNPSTNSPTDPASNQSPNTGAKTPQEILNELLRLRDQQMQQNRR